MKNKRLWKKETRSENNRICSKCRKYIAKKEDGICGICKPRGQQTKNG